MKPKVSIITPVYNHGKFIVEAIQSVLMQTFQDFEIIITNDGSTDNTAEELKKLKDPRIKIFTFERNQGIGMAMNNCIKRASGEYIAHLNADDIFSPDKLEKQVKFLDENKDVGAVFSYARIIDGAGKDFDDKNHFYYDIFIKKNRTRQEWLRKFFYDGNCLCHPSAVVRRKCFDEIGVYDERFNQNQDFELWTRLCLKYEIHIIPEKLVSFRVHSNSISGETPEKMNMVHWEMVKILDHYLKLDENDLMLVFPEISAKFGKTIDVELVAFYLAMIAIEVKQPRFQFFAVNALYNLLKNKKKTQELERLYDFNYSSFVKLAKSTDTFNFLSLNQLSRELAHLLAVIQQKEAQISHFEEIIRTKEKELFEIRTSLRWKIPNFIYKIYKNKLKKFIPRFFFDLARPVFVYLDKIQHGQANGNNRFKLDIKKIEKLKLNSINKISFKKSENPKASIVIPVYNKWRYTYSCLEALSGNIKSAEHEVIVVDDCSSDKTPEMMKKIENAVYVRNEKNLGFIGSCNAGAQKARGEYVVFLNNDTHILPGWLEALIETFEKNENIGLVGSKLVYPDGRLQEAGGIVWKNENVWNYGRFKDPDDFEFNYLKDVDYCSGASIMLPKKLFDRLGGFDSYYAPAYFEDTDLAFRVRQVGLRTVYQPKSEVIHFEGVSCGKDLKKGVKKYQEVNKKKFFARWKEVLEKENCTDTEGPIFARDRSQGKKLMLFLDWNVPTFDKDAGSFVAFEYLKMLKSLGYKIIFWPHNLAKIEPYTETLQQMGIETAYGEVSFEKFLKEYGSYIDISLVSRPEVAKDHLDPVKQYFRGKVIYIAHDLCYLRFEREAETNSDSEMKKKAEEMKALEESIMKKSDISLFFSDKEVEIVKKEFPGVAVDTMAWIQNLYTEENIPEFADREGIIFIGGFVHRPNIDSVIWFHDEIYPRIKDKLSDINITVIGSNATPEILALNDENFKIIGFAEEKDLPRYFGRNKIFAAPLRFGAGFKGKIAKAMSFGIPVVTTRIGSEGIGLTDGETALIADDAEEFADKIVKLYSDKEMWGKISRNSREHLKNNFSAEAAKEKFQAVLGELEK